MYLADRQQHRILSTACYAEEDFCQLEVLSVKKGNSGNNYVLKVRHPCHTQLVKASLYVDSSFVGNYVPGDILVGFGKLQIIENNKNPNEFDRKKYFLSKGIAHSFRISGNGLVKIDANLHLNTIADSLKRTVAGFLKPFSDDERLWGIVHALILAEKHLLSEEDLSKFSITGTLHVLAVSGMHMGLLFWTISVLLGWLRILRVPFWVISIVSVSSLFLFTIMVGMGTSVTRAFIMISILQCAKLLRRVNSGVNSLSLAGFFILLQEPYSIYDIGFQLSFSAVASLIVFPFRWINNVKPNVLKYPAGLLMASIVAQMGTTPIILFHFDQFPVYFLLANILVIPVVMIIMYCLVGYLILVSFGIACMHLKGFIFALSDALYAILQFCASLPNPTISGLNFSHALLFVGLIFIASYFVAHNMNLKFSFYWWFGIASCLVVNLTLNQIQRRNNTGYVLNLPGMAGMYIRTLTECRLITHRLSNHGYSRVLRNVKSLNKVMQVEPLNHLNLDSVWDSSNHIQLEAMMTLEGRKMVILGNVTDFPSRNSKLVVDYIILTRNYRMTYELLERHFKFRKIIVADMNYRGREYWNRMRMHHHNVVLVNNKGSFRL